MNKGLVGRWMMLFSLWFSPFVVMTASLSIASAAQGPQTFTLDGRIKQAGTTTPILDASVRIEVHVMNPSRTCVLYAEEQFVNTQTSNGYFNIAVGSNVGAGKRIAGVDPGLAMATVFQNNSAMTGTNVAGQTCAGGLYTPTTRDSRYFRIFVTPSSTAVTDQLADIVLDAVPTAMVAESAESVGGFGPADLLRVNTSGSQVLSQANLENVFTSSNYSVLTALLAGTSTLYNRPAANGTNVLPTIAAPASPAAGQIWYNAGNVYYHDGTSVRTISTGSSTSISAADGTAAAPTIGFASDPNTGWYLAGPDNLAASTGGVERARINENGNLGIGSSNPGARLTLGGDASASAWQAGGIGIRQNSANYTDTSSSGTVAFNYVNAFGVPTLLASSATTYTNASSFSMYPPVPGTNVTLTNSTALTINATALTGGGGVTNGYGLQVNAPTGATNNYAATFMGGNVGVGTTAPIDTLQVESATTAILGVNTTGSGATDRALIGFDRAGAQQWDLGINSDNQNSNKFFIRRTPGLNYVMTFAENGNVGIGTTAPTAALHLKAGTAAAGTAPLKLTAGPVNTTAEAGAIEFDGTSLFYTDSTNTRRTLGVAGSGITALTGDVTASGTGSVAATIANDAVTFAKMQNIATQRLLGRSSATTGDVEELQVGTGLTITGGSLNLTDTTDDDSFATLLGVCGDGFMPYRDGGVWTCLEARSDLVNDTLVLRSATGSFEGNQVTANSLRLNNAGAYVSINTPAAANYTLTLPADDGTTSGQVLTTDGAGVLTWTTITPGTGDFKADGTVPMTGALRAISGTKAAPGYTFVGDTDTGFFRVSDDYLGFTVGGHATIEMGADANQVSLLVPYVTSGAARGFMLKSGSTTTSSSSSSQVFNILGPNTSVASSTSTDGIYIHSGTQDGSGNTPGSDLRLVAGSGAGTNAANDGEIYLMTDGTERMTVAGSGNVGIGTTAPDVKLHVAGTIRVGDGGETCAGGNFTGGIRYNGGNLQFCNGTAWTTLGTGSGSGDFMADGSVPMTGRLDVVNGSASNPAVRFASDTNTGIYRDAADVLGISVAGSEAATFRATGTTLKNGVVVEDDLYFATNHSSYLYTPTSVGANMPATKFDLRNTANSNSSMMIVTQQVNNTGGSSQAAYFGAVAMSSGDTPAFVIGQSTGASAYAERARFNEAGNLGIGTTAPNTKLHVAGTIRVGDGAETCSGGNFTGGIRYNGGNLQFCNGTAWTTLGTGSGAGDFLANGSVPMTGTFKATNGSAASPSITFNSDQDTGIYGSGSNGLSIAAAGMSVLDVSIAGLLVNLNAAVTSSTAGAYKLNGFAGDPTQATYAFSNDNNTGMYQAAADTLAFATNGSERVRIGTTGNIGIGTTAPSEKLDVKGTLAISGSTSGAVKFAVPAAAGSATYTWPAAAPASNMVLQSDNTGALSWIAASTGTGDFKADGTVPMTGALRGIGGTTSAPGITFVGATGYGMFQTGTDVGFTSGGWERMRITGSSGNVGIGTTNPNGKLAISNAGAEGFEFIPASSAGINMTRYYNRSTTSHVSSLGQAADFRFEISSSGEKMRIASSGNVGIGTTAPSSTLDVKGDFAISGSTSGAVKFAVPAAAGSATYTWPAAAPASNMVLQSNSSGTLSWVSAGGGGLPAADGTAAAPSISFTSDTDTGIFRPGTDSIGFATSGGTRMTLSDYTLLLATGYGQGLRLDSGGGGYGLVQIASPNGEGGRIRFASGQSGYSWDTAISRPSASRILIDNNAGGAADLEVNGFVKVGTTSTLCPAAGAGSIRYNAGAMEFCDGASWTPLGTGSGTGDFMADGSVDMTGGLKVIDGGTVLSPAIRPAGSADVGISFSGNDISFSSAGDYVGAISITGLNFENRTINGANFIAHGGGAANLPDYRFVSDSNTGIFAPAADNLAISTNGTERIRVNADGALLLRELASSPAHTASFGSLYVKTDGKLYYKDESGTEVELGAGGGGTGDFMADGSVDMTGQFKAVDGNNAAPGISFASNPDTGFTWVGGGQDQIGLVIDGTELGYFNSGTFSWSQQIHAYRYSATDNGSAATPAFEIGTSSGPGLFSPAADTLGFSTASTERMRISSTGNVGIGTTAPGKSLEVTQASSTSGTPAVIGFTNAGIGNASSFALNQSDMISAGNGRRMLAQAYSGIELRGTRQTSGYTAPPAGASTDASVTVYGGSGDTPDAFKVVNNAGSSTFMTVTGAGRVGIGTTAPTLAGLEVRTAVSGRSGFFTGGGTNGAVSLGGTTGAGAIQGFTNGGGDAPILLQSNGGGAATVGIGTGTAANVTTRLYVNGSIKIGDGGELCPAAGAGAIKWNGTAIQFCDGSTWANIGGAGGSGDFMADGSVAMTDTLVLAGGVLGTGGVSFNGDPDTGIISNTSNVVSIMSGNSESANFQTSVINLLRKTNFTDGTAALPALSFSADPNTGIYRPGTDMVAVSTNATEHLRILANGNVGIGTTNPLAKLHVTGDIFTNSSLNIGYAEDGKMMGFGDWTNYIAGDSNVHYVKIGTNNNERMRIIANGDVGIGTTAPTEKLDVNGNVRATSFISTSDQRLKRDITSVPGLEAIMRLNGVTWNWKDSGQADMGVIAQEVEKVFPQSVVTNAGTGYKAVKYDSLIAPLIESTKELYGMCLASEKRNDKQDREIASLKEENKQLKSEVEDLKKRMERIENLLLKSVK